MYNIKGPSKIVAKTTRRGITQNVDSYRDIAKNKLMDTNVNEFLNIPKPTFQNNSKRLLIHNNSRQQDITPHHEEIIKYIHDSWSSIYSNSERGQSNTLSSVAVVYYKDEPCPHLQDFIPFDLEAWWGKRLYNIITNSANVRN